MWYEDLTQCDYISKEYESILTAIGWLENGKDFSTGSIPKDVYLKILELSKIQWSFATYRGYHYCDLCRFQFEHCGGQGDSNIFVPGNGKVYVCPSLITHYINTHFYLPPREFIEAVYLCPPIHSIEYLKKIEENGGKAIAELIREE